MESAVNPYEQGHLVVAALRIFVHRQGRPPSVRELSEVLGISAEMGYYLCNRLSRLGVLEVVGAAFEEKLYLKDHLKLEDLPREEKASSFATEVERLKEERQRRQEEMAKLQSTHEGKKKDLFSDLERQLREGVKKKKNPLDEL
jgi:hypothetical protein